MTSPKLFLAGMLGLAALVLPVSHADTVAGTPDATVHADFNLVGRSLSSLPLLDEEVHPNTTARYYIYLCSASWCGPCNKEMPHVVEAYKEMQKTGYVELVLADFDRTEDDARAYIAQYGVTFPATMGNNVANMPGFSSPRSIPFAIIVDAMGNVIKKGHGSLIQDWKSIITAWEKEQGKTLSFPESSVTLSPAPERVLADAEMPGPGAQPDEEDEEDDEKPGQKVRKGNSKVARALAGLTWLTENQPNPRAKHYIYLCSASWCGPCNAEMPQIAEVYGEMKRSGTELILVSFDNTPEAAKAFLERYKAEFPVMMQSEGPALPGIEKPNGIPFCCIVDSKGKLLYAGHGSAAREWYKYTGDKKPRDKKDKKDKKGKKGKKGDGNSSSWRG